MNITKSKSSITIKIDFNDIRNLINEDVSDNEVKEKMQEVFEKLDKKFLEFLKKM